MLQAGHDVPDCGGCRRPFKLSPGQPGVPGARLPHQGPEAVEDRIGHTRAGVASLQGQDYPAFRLEKDRGVGREVGAGGLKPT